MAAESDKCLVIGVEHWIPNVYLYGRDSNLVATGAMIEVLKIILSHLGYCYKFIRPSDRQFGSRLPNGTWNGLAGLVHQGIADMTGQGLYVTEGRLKDFSVSEYVFMDGLTATYKRPGPQSDMAGFVKPYTTMVWTLLLVSLLGVLGATATVRLINYLVTQDGLEGKEGVLSQLRITLQESTSFTTKVLLCQNVTIIPRGDSVRTISCLWLLISFILATVYRANLKAMLILPKFDLPFNSLKELVESDIQVWAATGSHLKEAMENSPKTSSMGQLQDKLIQDEKIRTNVGLAVRGLLRGDFACVIPRSSVLSVMHDSFSARGHCVIYALSSNVLDTTVMSYTFRKGSPLKEQIDPVIRRLRESGIINQIYKNQLSNSSECVKPVSLQSRGDRPLDLGDFYGVFLLYAGGIVLAIICFVLECILGNLV